MASLGNKHALVHGHGHGTPTYRTWQAMRARCDDPASDRYCDYGGRGISYDPRWASFSAFLADMGERPDGKTLDRIHNDQDYEPGNCRWATPKEQARHRRNSVKLTLWGEAKLLIEWCEELGVKYQTAYYRLSKGMAPEDALNPRLLRPLRRHQQLS